MTSILRTPQQQQADEEEEARRNPAMAQWLAARRSGQSAQGGATAGGGRASMLSSFAQAPDAGGPAPQVGIDGDGAKQFPGGIITRREGTVGDGPPKWMPTNPPQTPQAPAAMPTFRELQQRRQARPGPPPPPTMQAPGMGPMVQAPGMIAPPVSAPAAGPTVAGPQWTPQSVTPTAQSGQFRAPQDPNRQALIQSVGQMLANPSAYGSDQVMESFNRLRGGLDREFADQRTALDTDLARRGLSDSTGELGALGTGGSRTRLAADQSRALTNLGGQLLEQQARDLASARALAIQNALDVGRQGTAESLQEFDANRALSNDRFNQALQAAGFSQDAQRDLFNQTLAAAGFNRDTSALGFDQGIRAADFNRDTATLGFDQGLRAAGFNRDTSALGFDQGMRAAGFNEDARRFGINQDNLDRDQTLREMLGLGGMDAERERFDIGRFDADQARLFQGEQNEADRAIDRNRVQAQTDLANNQLWMQFAQMLGLNSLRGMAGGSGTGTGGTGTGGTGGTGSGTPAPPRGPTRTGGGEPPPSNPDQPIPSNPDQGFIPLVLRADDIADDPRMAVLQRLFGQGIR